MKKQQFHIQTSIRNNPQQRCILMKKQQFHIQTSIRNNPQQSAKSIMIHSTR